MVWTFIYTFDAPAEAEANEQYRQQLIDWDWIGLALMNSIALQPPFAMYLAVLTDNFYSTLDLIIFQLDAKMSYKHSLNGAQFEAMVMWTSSNPCNVYDFKPRDELLHCWLWTDRWTIADAPNLKCLYFSFFSLLCRVSFLHISMPLWFAQVSLPLYSSVLFCIFFCSSNGVRALGNCIGRAKHRWISIWIRQG